jgi:hypothetical protein
MQQRSESERRHQPQLESRAQDESDGETCRVAQCGDRDRTDDARDCPSALLAAAESDSKDDAGSQEAALGEDEARPRLSRLIGWNDARNLSG